MIFGILKHSFNMQTCLYVYSSLFTKSGLWEIFIMLHKTTNVDLQVNL